MILIFINTIFYLGTFYTFIYLFLTVLLLILTIYSLSIKNILNWISLLIAVFNVTHVIFCYLLIDQLSVRS